MIFYAIYRFARFLAMNLPLGLSYGLACVLADIKHLLSRRDRRAVIENLRVVTDGTCDDAGLNEMTRQVFRNFGKYLVDFFRFAKVDDNYIRKFVRIDGLANLSEALSRGKGVILLSAHLGSWELGGCIISSIGYPLNAVALTHQDRMVNDFFMRQRMLGKVRPIEIGLSLRECYRVLKKNGLVALLGDRDFTKNGTPVAFFGKKALIPRGPSVFAARIGSAIVPTFMIREEDDTFRLVFETPIYPESRDDEGETLMMLTRRYLSVVESYIRRFPVQWYAFRRIWE
ncbi:MAG: lysophospholipid acyltransferase family protein [Candidatus Omnitrophota bacterium]